MRALEPTACVHVALCGRKCALKEALWGHDEDGGRRFFRSIAKERKAIVIAYAWDQFHVFARCTRLDVPMVQVMCEFDGGIPHIGCARRAARAHDLGHDERKCRLTAGSFETV